MDIPKPIFLIEEEYSATLEHSGVSICRLINSWEKERLFLSKRAQIYGTWHYAEIDAATNPFEEEDHVKAAKYYWKKRLQHKVSWLNEWKDEKWEIVFAGGFVLPIFPPIFDSNTLMRWFYPDRSL